MFLVSCPKRRKANINYGILIKPLLFFILILFWLRSLAILAILCPLGEKKIRNITIICI